MEIGHTILCGTAVGCTRFYINGEWIRPDGDRTVIEVENPATEAVIGRVLEASEEDVDRAVAAARAAFADYSQSSRADRLALLDRVIAACKRRADEMAAIISEEMGASRKTAAGQQVPAGINHLQSARDALESFEFETTTAGGNTIAREEIFGPVLSIIGYEDEEDAIRIANDTPYGLAACIFSGSPEHARKVAARLRAGYIEINDPAGDPQAPFGGFKQSGIGREKGPLGFESYLEIKSVVG